MTALLRLDELTKQFRGPRGKLVHALNGISLSVSAGETVAVVGESGSGKSTLGRIALCLERASSGQVIFEGADITNLPQLRLRRLRPRMQMVFQDPWATLNPRLSIAALLEEPFLLHSSLSRVERRRQAEALGAKVRLDTRLLGRYPAQVSGGQLQRVAIARAIATSPRLVVLDEPTSSLDLSVRAEILALLAELQQEFGTAYLFISHDLATVRLISQRIVVMYLGRIVEFGPTEQVFAAPRHPYTQALLSAQLSTFPNERPQRQLLSGDPPSPIDLPKGCPFHTRCPVALAICSTVEAAAVSVGPGHGVVCVHAQPSQSSITL